MGASVLTIDEAHSSGILEGASCALGVFDGMHLGHRFIIDRAISDAQDGKVVAITFDVDPDELFRPKQLRKLMNNAQRIDALAESAVDFVVVLPFTREFAAQTPEDFMDVIFGAHVPASLHVGSDFRFGREASGGVDDLRRWGSIHGMRVNAYELYEYDGKPITATRIRELLDAGDVAQVQQLLGEDAG